MTDRQIDNLIKPATIADTDPASNRVRAQHGGITTDWLPYIVPFAGGVSVWRIPSVGEACTILSPAGEPENGVVLCCQASDRYPAPSADPAETVVRFPDGTHIRYNHNSGAMELKAVTSLT
ncbi:TPA: phage baseplate assembly protein V, partial [Neisseria gonorrhoeae]